jgi:endogenous inhibitor of DNA gyrase (YacG/DUF329 family)
MTHKQLTLVQCPNCKGWYSWLCKVDERGKVDVEEIVRAEWVLMMECQDVDYDDWADYEVHLEEPEP